MTPAPVQLLGPPGREQLPLLPPPAPEDDVRNRRVTPLPLHVRHSARVVAEALFSSDAGPAEPSRLDWVAQDLMDFMARSPGRARFILRLSLFALTFLAPLFVFRPLPLGWLSLPVRVRALERMEHSVLGPAALAVKAMLCMLWFEHPDTRRETNTPITCLRSALVSGQLRHVHAGGGPLSLDCEVVVVGSGAGGAVAATTLAESGRDVVVLEEGPHVPFTGELRPSESIRHTWRDGATTLAFGLGGSPSINVTSGRCLGGSSTLTGGVCFRIPEHVLHGWVSGGPRRADAREDGALVRAGGARRPRRRSAGGPALEVHQPVR